MVGYAEYYKIIIQQVVDGSVNIFEDSFIPYTDGTFEYGAVIHCGTCDVWKPGKYKTKLQHKEDCPVGVLANSLKTVVII